MEIKFAICDDELELAQYVRTLVTKWADKNNIGVTIDMFESAEHFKTAQFENIQFDILLLDVQMSGQNGVDLAKEIRESDTKLSIIFITGFTDYMSEGYDVSALHYLIKPVKQNKLFETLDRAAEKLEKSKRIDILLIDADGVNFKIPLDEIIYIEAFGHSVTIHTTDGKYDVQQNIGQIENELDNNFFRCHRSYIAGLKYIRKISKTEILLDTGNTIPLSRRIYNAANQAFINYYKTEEI